MGKQLTRREFLKTSAAASGATIAAPSILSAQSPNNTVRLAGIGVGGKGWTDIRKASKFGKVVAVCDVDSGGDRAGYKRAKKKWPDARVYRDMRKLFDEEHNNIDAVTITTPDHMHAYATMRALKQGISPYTQKPLTRTVHEARALRRAKEQTGLATQMGNQHHSGAGYRQLVKTIRQGYIGKVKRAHTWSNRPIWPQGMKRPDGSDPVPDDLDWNLWLGTAPERPFKKDVYHPFKWRGWYAFGAGALGDMGCHIIDPVVWALELGPASSVSYEGPNPMPETFPKWEILTYTFPGTGYTAGDEFTMTWHDGGKKPSTKNSHIPDNKSIPGNGSMFVGEEGTLLCGHGARPKLYPREKYKQVDLPGAKGLNHYKQWINGIKNDEDPNSNFSYAGPLTETVLLGVIASRIGSGTELKWDSQNLRFTNSRKANQYIREEYRDGWKIKGL
jgi:predicted dehydrogenase